MTDDELNRIESQATHTRTKADTLALVAEVRKLRAALSALAALVEYHASGIVIDRHGVYTVDGPYVLGEHDGTPGDIADVLTKATKDGAQ